MNESKTNLWCIQIRSHWTSVGFAPSFEQLLLNALACLFLFAEFRFDKLVLDIGIVVFPLEYHLRSNSQHGCAFERYICSFDGQDR